MTTQIYDKPVEILLVEDNPGDVTLLLEAFKEAEISNPVHRVEDGVEALAYLRKEGKYVTVNSPSLILLDLNLPRKDGREVLRTLKSDVHLKEIPVIVLTSSKSEADVLRSYSLHANAYITKPVDMEEFLKVVRAFGEFWLSIVKLPSRSRIP